MKKRPSLLLVIFCLGIGISNYYLSSSETNDLLTLIAVNIIPVVFVWFIYVNFSNIKWRSKMSFVAYFVLLATAVFSEMIVYQITLNKLKASKASLESTISTYNQKLINDSPDDRELLNKLVKASNKIEKLELLVNHYLKGVNENSLRYNTKLEAIGWSEFFSLDRLSNDINLAESKVMLKKAREFYIEYDKTFQKITQEYISSTVEHGIFEMNSQQYEQMVSAYNDTYKALSKSESDILESVAAICHFLDKNYGNWKIVSGKIAFDDAWMYNRYTDLMNQLQSKISYQNRIKEQSKMKALDLLKN